MDFRKVANEEGLCESNPSLIARNMSCATRGTPAAMEKSRLLAVRMQHLGDDRAPESRGERDRRCDTPKTLLRMDNSD